LPPHLRGDRGAAGRERAHPRPRGRLPPTGGPHRQAQPHRGVPALDQLDHDWNPGASGARSASSSPAGCASATPASAAATSTTSGASCRCAWCSTPSSPVGRPAHRHRPPRRPRRGRRGAPAANPWPRARTGSSDGRGPRPQLWWPHALGDQPLYDVHVEVLAESGALSDERWWPLGLRTVELRDWIATVNGERLFLKGTNLGRPGCPRRGRAGRDRRRRHPGPRGRARPRAGARPHQPARALRRRRRGRHAAVAGPPAAVGLQPHGAPGGPPPGPGGGRPARPPPVAVRLVRPQRAHGPRRRAGHPGQSPQPAPPRPADGRVPGPAELEPLAARPGHQDRARARRRHPARWWPTPGYSPICLSSTAPTATSGSDGSSARSATSPACSPAGPAWPASSASFGARPCPTTTTSSSRTAGPTSTGTGWPSTTRCRSRCSNRHVPPAEFATYEDWKDATRDYQARLVRYHVETLRRLKYQPPAGFTQFVLADSSPAVSAALLTTSGRPSRLRRPARRLPAVIVVATGRPSTCTPATTCRSTCPWSATPYRISRYGFACPSVIRNGATACVVVERHHPARHLRPRRSARRFDVPDSRADSRTEPSDHGNGPVALVVDFELVGDGLERHHPLRHVGRRRCPRALIRPRRPPGRVRNPRSWRWVSV